MLSKKLQRGCCLFSAMILMLVVGLSGGVAQAARANAKQPSATITSKAKPLCPSSSCKIPLPGQVKKGIRIGFANGGVGFAFLNEQQRMFTRLAQRYGWKAFVLNNNASGPTAVTNMNQFVEDKVQYVIEFQIDGTVNPVLHAKAAAAHITLITEGIPGPGEYFTSDDDHATGVAAGIKLGDYAKANWNCAPDLVLLAASTPTGAASTERVGGDIAGVLSVCPNIPSSDFVQWQVSNDTATGVAAASDALVADPTAKKILVGGLNDLGVTQAITAAEQLGRASELYAWGGDGSDLGAETDAHYAGSIQFFLEAGLLPAWTIALELAAHDNVKKGFTPTNPTLIAATCPMSESVAATIPGLQQRGTKELAEYPKKTAAQLFCPAS
jgi:hypothetical protein